MGKNKFKKKPGASLDDRRKALREAAKELKKEKKLAGSGKPKFSIEQLLDKAEDCIDRFEYEVAQKFCQRALEMDADNVRALETSGSLLVDLGNHEAAKQCFGRAVEICPEEGFSKYMNLGQLFEGAEAVQCYQKGIELMVKEKEQREAEEVAAACGGEERNTVTERDISTAYLSIAELYMTDCCDDEDAEERCKSSIEKAIAADDKNPDALQLMASFLLLKQNTQEAREMIKRSVDMWLPQFKDESADDQPGPSMALDTECSQSFESRLSAAKILIEVEEYEISLDVLETCLEENDEMVDVWYLMGWASYLQGEGEKDTARSYLNKAKKIYVKTKVEDPDLLKHLDELLESVGPGPDEMDSDEDQNVEEEELEEEINSDEEEEEGEDSMEH